MTGPHPVYRTLLRLYPRDFRDEYAADLVQHFADLARDRGRGEAWRRTGIDLLVSVPRYRLESTMRRRHGSIALNLVPVALVAGGLLSVLGGAWPGLVLFGAAGLAGVARRGTFATTAGASPSGRRRRWLGGAAIFALVLAVAAASYLRAIADGHIGSSSLLVHDAVGLISMIGVVACLLAAQRSPGATREVD